MTLDLDGLERKAETALKAIADGLCADDAAACAVEALEKNA